MITITYTWTAVLTVTRQADKREEGERAPDITERDSPLPVELNLEFG